MPSHACSSISCCIYKLLPLLPLLLLVEIFVQIQHVSTLRQSGLGSDDEVNLVKFLFEHGSYNQLIRPVTQLNHTVEVGFGLAMIQLIHVEEKSQIMKSNVWLRMTWKDYQLRWDPADFGGIGVIRISPKKVWKPDIVLFNNADGKYEVSWQPNILIYNDGSILWIPPAIYKSSCTIDVTYFPFDQQSCDMKFGSWTFDASQVVLGWYEGKHRVDLTDYWKSGTWDIIKCPGVIQNETKPGQPPTTQVVFQITLRRKTLFYTVNLIIPCVLISFLSVCVFYLPADAGEKMTLCISILLALVVFLLLVSKILPPTSISIPLISKFLLFTFIMNIFTIVITVVIINWNFRTPRTHKMPRWVRTVFMQYLPLVLFMKRPEHIIEEERRKKRIKQMTAGKCNGGLLPTRERGDRFGGDTSASTRLRSRAGPPSAGPGPLVMEESTLEDARDAFELQEVHHPNCRLRQRFNIANSAGGAASDDARDSESPNRFAGVEITPEMRRAISAINFISTHLRIEDEYSRVLQDWKYVASVIDRVELVIFVTVTIAGTIGILMNAPHIFDFVDQDAIMRKNIKAQ